MALRTLGTNATTSLQAVLFNPSSGVMTDSDLAALNALVKPDVGKSGLLGTYFQREGQLYIPARGYIKIFAGDYVAVDAATGWPILLSAAAIAGGPYTHT